MNKLKVLEVSKKDANLRVDVFLAQKGLVSSRSQALKLLSNKKVLLNKKPLKASYCLREKDILFVSIENKPEFLKPYQLPLDIVFEDEDILVINKPAGLVVHPAPGHEDKTLVNVLASTKKLSSGSHPLRPGIVHRLDKDTSGLLLLAKTNQSEKVLIEDFKKRRIQREYRALSLRPPSPVEGRMESWLSRHPVHRKKFISLKEYKTGSKKAITLYQLIKQHSSGISWIKCQLETGRTHQIRVHLSSLSCPLIGDSVYGSKKLSCLKDSDLKKEIQNLKRIALHAQSLRLSHPRFKKTLYFKTDWPEDLKNLIKKLEFL